MVDTFFIENYNEGSNLVVFVMEYVKRCDWMKKDWERPKLEVLDVSETKKGFGPPWGRGGWKDHGGGKNPDPDDLLGS